MSVFLSRLSLNLRSRQVRADLADVHDLHRTIMRNFDPGAGNRASQQVLFRLEPMTDAPLTVLVQSATRPAWQFDNSYLLHPAETKEITSALASLRPGQHLRFRLRANPTRRPAAPDRRNAPRVPLTSWDDRLAWLRRKFDAAGALPIDGTVDVVAQPRDTGKGKTDEHRISIWPVIYEGTIEVIDAERLRDAITAGIGPARAYGNGLLSIASAR